MNKYNAVLCRYNEIALKGANRPFFEKLLVENIKRNLGDLAPSAFHRLRGRVLIKLNDSRFQCDAFLNIIRKELGKVFGLVSFSPGYIVSSSVESIEKTVLQLFRHHYDGLIERQPENTDITYRIRVRRSHKLFPLSSNQLEIYFADKLLAEYSRLRVNLKVAQIDIGIEVRKEWTFIYNERFAGPGGLPSGSNGTALALLSGGIDSPVASYLVMKRGCPLHFLTFHSYPYTTRESVSKVDRIVDVLNTFQMNGKLFSCNMAEGQKIIRDNCCEKYRTILYRRLMLRISDELAHSLSVQALVTGDSIGQVASQTIPNMDTIDHASDMLILRPLVGMDKLEITDIARTIGTLNISQENCPDSCTVFSPRRPATSTSLKRIEAEEQKINIPELVSQAITTIDLVKERVD